MGKKVKCNEDRVQMNDRKSLSIKQQTKKKNTASSRLRKCMCSKVKIINFNSLRIKKARSYTEDGCVLICGSTRRFEIIEYVCVRCFQKGHIALHAPCCAVCLIQPIAHVIKLGVVPSLSLKWDKERITTFKSVKASLTC